MWQLFGMYIITRMLSTNVGILIYYKNFLQSQRTFDCHKFHFTSLSGAFNETLTSNCVIHDLCLGVPPEPVETLIS